jgi:hypothetical protein
MGTEQSSPAISFGLVLVARVTPGLDVGVTGRSLVSYGVDVVVLQSPAAAAVGALPAGEFGNGPEVEGGPKFGRLGAAVTFDGVDVDPVMQHGTEEGVLGQVFSQMDRDRTTVDEVTCLARMGVAASPGEEIAHNHQFGPMRSSGSLGPSGEGGQDVGSIRFPSI